LSKILPWLPLIIIYVLITLALLLSLAISTLIKSLVEFKVEGEKYKKKIAYLERSPENNKNSRLEVENTINGSVFECNNLEEYIKFLEAQVFPLVVNRFELIDRVSLIEVNGLKSMGANCLCSFTDSSIKYQKSLDNLDCSLVNSLVETNQLSTVGNFAHKIPPLDTTYQVYCFPYKDKSEEKKQYFFLFHIDITSDAHAWRELVSYVSQELMSQLSLAFGKMFEMVRLVTEMEKLKFFATDVKLNYLFAIVFLNPKDIPEIENRTLYSKPESVRIGEILNDPLNVQHITKAFKSRETDEARTVTISRQTYNLSLIPVFTSGKVLRIIMFVDEAPGRQLSEDATHSFCLSKLVNYLYNITVKDDHTELLNKWAFFQLLENELNSFEYTDEKWGLFVLDIVGESWLSSDENYKSYLHQVANVITQYSELGPFKQSLAARYEGAIFLLLMKVAGLKQAEKFGEAIKQQINEEISISTNIQVDDGVLNQKPQLFTRMGLLIFSPKMTKLSVDTSQEVRELINSGMKALSQAKNQQNMFIIDKTVNGPESVPVDWTKQTLESDEHRMIVCSICHLTVLDTQEKIECAKCGALHHKECWEFNDRTCGVLNCGSKEAKDK